MSTERHTTAPRMARPATGAHGGSAAWIIIVGATTLLLAGRLDRSSTVFRVFRLAGVVQIAVTGIVYHFAFGATKLDTWLARRGIGLTTPATAGG
jgi:hypothetical protein